MTSTPSSSTAAATGGPEAGAAAFVDALIADVPATGTAGNSNLYDPLIGSWVIVAIDHLPDGGRREQTGEVHFAWVLEGRAVQDVWIVPARAERGVVDPRPAAGNRCGITLRVYDPDGDTWLVTWVNASTRIHERLVGRQDGDRIVQEGVRQDGSLIRWSFVDITPDSFGWRGERSRDGGASWDLEAEFLGRRVGAGSDYADRASR